MAGRRKVYGGSTVPRYRAKMYDYLSRGGRIPMVLTMEVVDAMGDSWTGGFFSYKSERDTVIAQAYERVKDQVPHCYLGLAKALFMHIQKLHATKGLTYSQALERVAEENRLTGNDPVFIILQTAVNIKEGTEEKTPATTPKP